MTKTIDTKKIAELNDKFRSTLSDELGSRYFTRGISALGLPAMATIAAMVGTFNEFTPDNDPHGEHDFGSLTYGGQKLFWKIDYYDRASFGTGRDMGSENPADPDKTVRVLTIMLASEY